MTDIHPQLQQDCLIIGHFPLSRLLLNKDANYPWFVLVPDRENISEIHQLTEADQQQLMRESSYLSAVLAEQFGADKMNVAAIGNVVPQLHIHHIVRYKDDIAWPSPVWGKYPSALYSADQLERILLELKNLKLQNFEYEI